MPTVMQRLGTTSIDPPVVFALIVRVSRDKGNTRVCRSANASNRHLAPQAREAR